MADSVTPSTSDSGDAGDPNFRFIMANERTFLAWQRTALGLLAAAVAVVQFVPHALVPGARNIVAAVLAVLAVLTAVTGIRRWEQVDAAVRTGRPIPDHHMAAWLSAGLVLVAALGMVLLIGGKVPG